MDRAAFFAELAKFGTEYSPDFVEGSNALLAPMTLQPVEELVTRDLAYGPHERHRFNLFRPEGGEPAPCILFVHDGGFVMGDKGPPGAPFYNNVGAWAQREGFACAAMNYRFAPEVKWPAGREDVIAAVLNLVQHAGEYGIDSRRIVLMGHSAGATHVADTVAAPGAAAQHIAGAVISAGFYDLSIAVADPFKPQYYGEDTGGWPAMSALPGLVASAVPCLFAVGELDMAECQQQAMALARAWFEGRGRWPVLHVQKGHNHMTGCRQIGSPVDSFGPVVGNFVREL